MARRACSRRELLDRWQGVQEELEDDDPSPSKQRRIIQAKEEWFSDSFEYLINLPKEDHIWCGYSDLMGPLLESFHSYFRDEDNNSLLRLIWNRVSREMGFCTQCVCQHHQAQESYDAEYQFETVDPLLKVLHFLDDDRVAKRLKEMNARIRLKEYDPECHSAEVVSVMFEVLMFPILLDDLSLAYEFQLFIESIDESFEVTLSSNQQYPGVYALLFFKSGKARAIGLRLARYMGKLRRAADLEPLQPLIRKYINCIELEVMPSTMDTSRPRVQLERANVWLGIKLLLGFLEAPAFEDGILERYPIFLNIILNHVSDDSSDFSCAVSCLKASFLMLGCKLWLRTTLSPSVIRNTLLGHCFHTRDEKSHKEIFDLFLPFLQSLEALQDGEHEKQRRSILYFLLHQVTRSSNFSALMRKNACKIALLIVHRGYTMNPPCPPSECAHMWGPSLVSSLKDSSLHISLRQPAFDLINVIIVSDVSALISVKSKGAAVSTSDVGNLIYSVDDEDEMHFFHGMEKDNSCWSQFSIQNKLSFHECKDWRCVPLLWYDTMVQVDSSMLPISLCKAVFWALSHIFILESGSTVQSSLPVNDWLAAHAGEITSSFTWEVPAGCDDGGDGKVPRNSVKLLPMSNLLMRTFIRFSTHFVTQFERNELQKQWTWEPKMAESLILLLVGPNDNVRQAGRAILEHISKARGLTPGLQFLCSCASSSCAMFLGLRYALKLVQVESVLAIFHSLHHLFFVTRKLLKEVITLQESSVNSKNYTMSVASLSEGGFLRQPCSNYFPDKPGERSTNVVDMDSWEQFSYLLSAVFWPFMLKCLTKAEELVNSKHCQMTSVRLLEVLAVVFEKLSSCPIRPHNVVMLLPNFGDLTWLSDLVRWGKSSLIVITRHWKQCMLSILETLKGSHSWTLQNNISSLESAFFHDRVDIDELQTDVSNLNISLSKLYSRTGEEKQEIEKQLNSKPSFGKESTILLRHINSDKVASVKGMEQAPLLMNDVIDISDSEAGEASTTNFAGRDVLLDVHTDSVNSNCVLPGDQVEPFQLKPEDGLFSLQEQTGEVLEAIDVSSKAESTDSRSTIISTRVGADKKMHKSITSITSTLVKNVKSSDKLVGQQSAPLTSSSEVGKGDTVIRSLIHVDENDPLEHALNNYRRPQLLPTKISITGPKRQAVQLQLPSRKESGLLNRMGTSVRRLKPPRLDQWYRDILEMDYFGVVGLTSADGDANKQSASLKEVPLYFHSQNHYVEIFRPLVLEEFKAQLQNAYVETSSDDMVCGSLCILSVEKIDNFLLVRGRPDTGFDVSRGCIENDLVLLTKEPLKSSSQHVHALGKVERRDKTYKNQSLILVIRFSLSCYSLRSSKLRRLLVERSNWYLSRIMSITPQIREFHALSSLHDIPMLPVILNPVDCSLKYPESGNKLDKLPQPMYKVLSSSFNESQLRAISIAIGSQDPKKSCELSLIQGPPGTGKTRTIVAIVSALLAFSAVEKNCSSYFPNRESKTKNIDSTNTRAKINQSAAVARAWQDAAFARQMIKDSEKYPSGPIERHSKGRVLVCAQSNAAVDELVSRLSEGLHGNDGKMYKPYIVRVGNAKTVHPNSLPIFIDTLVEQRLAEEMNQTHGMMDFDAESSCSLRTRLEKVVDSIRNYESKRAKLNEADMAGKGSSDGKPSKEDDILELPGEAIGAKLTILYGQKKEICRDLSAAQAREKKVTEESKSLKHKVRKSILSEAEIVATTLSGCGGDIYGVCSESNSASKFGNFSEQTLFDIVVIDEAAQALEPATLIPLQLLKSCGTKCIMVGDPKQLPATVFSGVASKFMYECSMFERLQRAGHPVMMLTEQYRMHPEICRFPSLHFYENKLLNGTQMAGKSSPFHEHYFLGPYMFFDITDGHERCGNGPASQSLCNESEADVAVEILKLLKKGYPSEFTCNKIGVITPYRSQLSLLRSRFAAVFGPEVVSNMELNTVDGFQGREVDILVLSTVRASGSGAKSNCSKSGSIGFVADVRRMNVALTRAKFSLWIIGSARTLKTNLHWAALIQDAKERKLFVSVGRPYNSIFGKSVSSKFGPGSLARDSYASHSQLGERGKDNSSSASCEKARHRKDHRRKAKHADRNVDKGVNEDSEERRLISLKESQKFANNDSQAKGLLKQDAVCSKEVVSMVARRQSESNSSTKQNDQSATEESRPENDITFSSLGCKRNANAPLQTVAKGARKYSQNQKSTSLTQCDSTLSCPGKGKHQTREVEKRKPTNLREQDHFVAARKRQREAVDSLLSSALISSKKPPSNSASVRRQP